MSGSDHPSRAGRLTAVVTLAVSATLFLTALFGISSIDPAADAAGPDRPAQPAERVSLAPATTGGERDRDCPWRDRAGGGASERPHDASTS